MNNLRHILLTIVIAAVIVGCSIIIAGGNVTTVDTNNEKIEVGL